MHQRPGPVVESSAAMENTRRAASAHPDGVAARERDDVAPARLLVPSFNRAQPAVERVLMLALSFLSIVRQSSLIVSSLILSTVYMWAERPSRKGLSG
jgi:hypothetical protein